MKRERRWQMKMKQTNINFEVMVLETSSLYSNPHSHPFLFSCQEKPNHDQSFPSIRSNEFHTNVRTNTKEKVFQIQMRKTLTHLAN
jgi:hypothetical protein